MTAKIAPVWMAMSKTLTVASLMWFCMPSSWPARIRWPVLEIGRNSVNPSTMPITAAFNNITISTQSTLS